MRSQLLEILLCPEDRSRLSAADGTLLAEINTAISQQRVFNAAGTRLEQTIEGGLVREAGDLLYPVVDQIPVLLRDEAIALDQLRRVRTG